MPERKPSHWFVFVGENPEPQLNKLVICPNFHALHGVTAHSHWRHVPEDIVEGDRVWFFRRTFGIDTLCEISGPMSDDRPHAAFPERYPISYQWPTKVIARFEYIKPARFGQIYYGAGGHRDSDVPVGADGKFSRQTYCHRLSDAVAAALAHGADGSRTKRVASPYNSVATATLIHRT
ncbi:MAG: hypothetical protein HQL40_09095 [Alphaproteobacteria bacterium]|nr:hypothetical protein [Alphaproteobacteria bacterium]